MKRRAVFILGAKWKALVEGGDGIVWLAAWKLVSNDAKRTVAPPNVKHSTLLQGCFLCFCFFIPLTIRQQSIIYPHIFSTDSLKPHLYRYYSIGIGG